MICPMLLFPVTLSDP